MNYRKLFDYLQDQLGVAALQSDMQEIVNIVEEMKEMKECNNTISDINSSPCPECGSDSYNIHLNHCYNLGCKLALRLLLNHQKPLICLNSFSPQVAPYLHDGNCCSTDLPKLILSTGRPVSKPQPSQDEVEELSREIYVRSNTATPKQSFKAAEEFITYRNERRAGK